MTEILWKVVLYTLIIQFNMASIDTILGYLDSPFSMQSIAYDS